jgi:uncharacterized protein YcbX
MAALITDLHFYPIKSFRGFRVKELKLQAAGAEWDRQWMLVDDKNKALTQRELPQMARIGVAIEDFIELTLEGFGSVDFGLNETEGEIESISLGDKAFPAREVSGEISEWLTQVLSKKVRLMRVADAEKNRFFDASPVLVISKASLQDLETKIGSTMSMSRFRPNIVIDGIPAFSEDTWPKFKIGPMEFTAVKPCTRDKITTVHPLTGEIGAEPLKTLSTYRKGDKGVTFGYYYSYTLPGRIHTGQELTPMSAPTSATI